MKRSLLTRKINKVICDIAKGIFHDTYWKGPHIIINALKEIDGIDFEINNTRYRQDENGNPVAKEWIILVKKENVECIVKIIASGAGSVECPLEKYDVISYAS